MEEGFTRASLDADPDERFVPLRRMLGVTSFGLNEIVLRPGERGRIHLHHNQEEVFLVLRGELTILIEGEEQALAEGDLIRVAPGLKRQLVNAASEPLLLIALGGDGEHRGRDADAFTSWDQEVGAPPQEIPLPEDLPTG